MSKTIKSVKPITIFPAFTHQETIQIVRKKCNDYLVSNFGIGWNDLADNTLIEDFVDEEFDLSDKEHTESIVKDIVWDKLDLDGTIYHSMPCEQMSEMIYGGDDG